MPERAGSGMFIVSAIAWSIGTVSGRIELVYPVFRVGEGADQP